MSHKSKFLKKVFSKKVFLLYTYLQNKLFLMIFRPVSAYALFFRDTQAAIKGQNPNASFGEVSKIVASMWDGLDSEHKSVSLKFHNFYQLDINLKLVYRSLTKIRYIKRYL